MNSFERLGDYVLIKMYYLTFFYGGMVNFFFKLDKFLNLFTIGEVRKNLDVLKCKCSIREKYCLFFCELIELNITVTRHFSDVNMLDLGSLIQAGCEQSFLYFIKIFLYVKTNSMSSFT